MLALLPLEALHSCARAEPASGVAVNGMGAGSVPQTVGDCIANRPVAYPALAQLKSRAGRAGRLDAGAG